jgi:acetoin utilization protein AcuB
MKIRDIMSHNVVTVSSNVSIADAKRIMAAHKIRRLPVVDKGKLVGIVTERGVERVSPSKATSLSVWELSYLLEKTPVRDIMEKEVVWVSPDINAEEALALAQSRKVGSLVVIDDGHIVGIATTNDFFYSIINPLLGIGQPGKRVEVRGGGEAKAMQDILTVINSQGLKFTSIHIEQDADSKVKDVCFHIESDNVDRLLETLKEKGYEASIRAR